FQAVYESYLLLDMDTVEWPMAATVQPTAAVDEDMVKSTAADMGTMATAL
ncbi:hypothetical protein A2U01_0112998, partial [Trifolium medium]|nr:hypothetical protein [Trifolium medium]